MEVSPAQLDGSPEAAFRFERPVRIRSGPVAAVLAVAVVLGLTAVPGAVRPIERPTTSVRVERVLAVTGRMELSDALGSFVVHGEGRAEELVGGGARFTAEFVSERDASAGFELVLDLGQPRTPDATEGDAAAHYAPTDDPLRPLLRPMGMAERSGQPGASHTRVGATLSGTGALAGHLIELRHVGGSAVRRGRLAADGPEAITGRFSALATAGPSGEPRLRDATCDLVLFLGAQRP